MKILSLVVAIVFLQISAKADLTLAGPPGAGDFILADGKTMAAIFIETNDEPAALRAAGDLADDFARVTGTKPEIENQSSPDGKIHVIIGTIGKSEIIDRLAAEGKLDTNEVSGRWESHVLQVVKNPLPGVDAALVIAGSDRRGTIYGIYQLSELIGVSPWYWWADVPVKKRNSVAIRGDVFKQGPPAVKYRGIF